MNDNDTRIHELGDATQWPYGTTAPAPAADVIATPDRKGGMARGVAIAAGLVLAGALVGTVGVTALQGATRTTSTAQTSTAGAGGAGQGTAPQGTAPQGTAPQGTAPQGTDPQGAFPQGGPQGASGGLAGEERVQGTVTATGASSVTVKSTSGTATYVVNGSTDIRKDGAQVPLAQIKAGDDVLVHVFPSGSTMIAERVLAGSSATQGPGGSGGPPPGAAPQNT